MTTAEEGNPFDKPVECGDAFPKRLLQYLLQGGIYELEIMDG